MALQRWYFPLVRVSQVDDNGCGIACVATTCGTTYERARHEFFPRRKRFRDDKSIHVDSRRIQRAVRRLGFATRLSMDFRREKCPAILVFSWMPYAGWDGMHGVVWDPFEQRIHDPGYDHDCSHPPEFYFDLWKKSGYAAILVTGKRH